jgi:transposase
MRQEHKAGEKLFVDFPGDTLPIYDAKTGKVDFEAEIFVAVLGASSFVHAGAIASQQLDDWVIAHVRTFEAIGGCPAIVVCDNLKSGVTRPHRYEPDVNATYEDMAAHYGIAVIPARSYKPRDKALSSHCTSWVGLIKSRSAAVRVHARLTSRFQPSARFRVA